MNVIASLYCNILLAQYFKTSTSHHRSFTKYLYIRDRLHYCIATQLDENSIGTLREVAHHTRYNILYDRSNHVIITGRVRNNSNNCNLNYSHEYAEYHTWNKDKLHSSHVYLPKGRSATMRIANRLYCTSRGRLTSRAWGLRTYLSFLYSFFLPFGSTLLICKRLSGFYLAISARSSSSLTALPATLSPGPFRPFQDGIVPQLPIKTICLWLYNQGSFLTN